MGKVRLVQSCITNISFPNNLEDFWDMLKKNEYHSDNSTDIDTILNFKSQAGTCWTAPRWLGLGDILFFYHAVTAKTRIKRLLREATDDFGVNSNIVAVLKHSLAMSEKYGGSIFACGVVKGDSVYLDNDGLQHFKGRIFAPLGKVHLFEHPLTATQFSYYAKVSQQSALTPLFGNQFTGIKQLLSENNELPNFLSESEPESFGFRNIDKDNWMSVSCIGDPKFLDEAQVRAFFIDFALEEIKDEKSLVLQECLCESDLQAGLADYFISVNNYWLPVEAKFDVSHVKSLSTQLEKYINISYFVPKKGVNINKEYETTDSPYALVADRKGFYLTNNGHYIDCDSSTPLLKRKDINVQTLKEFRNKIMKKMTCD